MKQVFISYSTYDLLKTIEIRDMLENNGVSCWIGNRDIPPGANYTEEITQAINQCEFFVLMLTQNAEKSQYVISELECAVEKKKVIIPYLLEKFNISEKVKFHFRNHNWISAFEDPQQAKISLLNTIQRNMGMNISCKHDIRVSGAEGTAIVTDVTDIRYGKHRIPVVSNAEGKYQIVCRHCEYEYIDDTDYQQRVREWEKIEAKMRKIVECSFIVSCVFGIGGSIYGLLSQNMSLVIHIIWLLISLVPILVVGAMSETKEPNEKDANSYTVDYDETFCIKTFYCPKCHREFKVRIPIAERDKFIFKKNETDFSRNIL